ncbi:MAG TPA: DUF1634 domain-containing protein [Candidatus Acidoferrales bacterium]|nr:DUF1634 domain-containing protein [Candidatus Acidoferrales bacterium]
MGLKGWTDKSVEDIIGNLLRWGVLLAAATVLAGAVLYLARHGGAIPDYRAFRGEPAGLRHVAGIFAEAFAGRATGVIQLGLLLLIATPVARVAFSVVGFLLEEDWMYVGFTLIVLAVLTYSLFAG